MIESSQTLVHTRRFRLQGIRQAITIWIWKDDAIEVYSATASHAIKTPMQSDTDVPRPSDFSKSPENAADSVMGFYRSEYETAVEAGQSPSDDWLVPEK